jgi:hypothetical protein
MSKVPPSEMTGADGGAADLAAPRQASLREVAFEARKRAEAEIILAALDKHRWNRRRAAEALNISYRSLMYKMKYCGLRDCGSVSGAEEKDDTTRGLGLPQRSPWSKSSLAITQGIDEQDGPNRKKTSKPKEKGA